MPQTDAPLLPTLDGDRIRLRWLSETDVPALYEIFGDPVVTRYWAVPALPDKARAAELLAEIQDNARTRKGFQWGIARQTDGAVVGTCSLYRPDFENRRAEIGFALARSHWGHGYASDAVRVAIGYAFDVLQFRRLEADVDPRNTASLRTLERLGFLREGYLRERYRVNGEVQDSIYLGRPAWRRLH